MSEDAEIKLAPLAEEHGGIDLVLIGAGDPGAMVAHTVDCREAGLPFAADPPSSWPGSSATSRCVRWSTARTTCSATSTRKP
jgi:hypothetical protein